ncbi:carbohydrate ABC transporter permease [Ruania rhizosphaerae]|uniref:carbohydrate ABC transporter permease n=1 Tax=Ruania rhizosphaerae TaxID=1840413 RepID=UPI00135BE9F0|nr:carbohydrate ABC transporter permease [Ruania rhizosphaerae]
MTRMDGLGIGRLLRFIALVLLSVGTLFPLYFLVVTALKTNTEFATNYFLPPLKPDFSNLIEGMGLMGRFVMNSVFISLMTTLIILLVVVPAVYAFTWLRFPGAPILYTVAIASLMVPPVLTFIPQYILTRQLNLLNTHWGVILPFVATGIGLSVYLLRTFFAALPYELIEAARIEGAGEMRILRTIVLPLTVPSLVTVSVVQIVTTWNAFLWPLVVVSSESKRAVSVAVTFLSGSSQVPDTPALMAGYLAASIPLILILSALMRFFVRGMTEGALKG